MSNINLFESAQGKRSSDKGGFAGGKAFIIPFAVLVIVFAVFGAAKFYSWRLSQEKLAVEAQILSESSTLSGKNIDRVVNFDERMKLALKETSSKNNFSDYLKELENSMVSGAKVDSFKYSPEGSKINIVAFDFETMARQTLSFKKSKYFKDFKIGDASRDEEGKVSQR